jgi:Icc-related predicted phosphoesterase
VPPLDTPIDQAPLLDDTLKPVVEGGQVRMVGVGSQSVRDLIMKYQPTVGLHGHVHEASGAIRLGKTICINPGSEYNDGVLRGALLSIDVRKQKVSYQLTMG